MSSRFEQIVADLEGEFATFRLRTKERSLLMKVIYHALGMRLWCPDFLSDYTTVIISVVYMPAALIGTDAGYRTLRHERVHMRDCWRSGVLPFALSYLFLLPAVFTLRAYWELRGYTETMAVELEETGDISDETLDDITEQFAGPAYFWMCPFPGFVRRRLERIRARLLRAATSPTPR